MRWSILFLLFVAPLKMGNPIGGGESANFPTDIWQWLFMAWPPYLLGAAASLVFLAAILLYPPKFLNRVTGSIVLCWVGLALSAGIGLIRTTEWDYAALFQGHLIGVVCLVVAIWLVTTHDPAFRKAVVAVIVIATVFSWISGWRQRFGGLEETKQFAEARARNQGVTLHAAIKGRLEQNRSFGAFVNPNSYGAHLVLTGPLALLLLWRWARRFDPVRVSQPLFLSIGCVCFLGVLWFSGSRGAMVAFGGGIAVAAMGHPYLKRWRWVLAFAGIFAGVAAVWLLSCDRSLLSVSARGQYYLAAWRMFLIHPLTGVGLGEFFPYYLRLKPVGAEETRIAHSMVLCLLSQAGVIGGIAASLCLAVPAVFAVLPAKLRNPDSWLFSACVCGLSAWSIHSLIDFNVQIPGTVATAAVMALFLSEGTGSSVSDIRVQRGLSLFLMLFCIPGLWAFARVPGELAFQQASDGAGKAGPRLLGKRFEHVSRLLPWSPYPSWYYAKLCLHGGRPVRALAAMEYAAELSPHRSAFWHRLAQINMELGEYTRAASALAIAEEWYPGNASIVATKALLSVLEDMSLGGAERTRLLAVESVHRRSAHMQDAGEEIIVVLTDPPMAPGLRLLSLQETCDLLNRAALSWISDPAKPVRFVSIEP